MERKALERLIKKLLVPVPCPHCNAGATRRCGTCFGSRDIEIGLLMPPSATDHGWEKRIGKSGVTAVGAGGCTYVVEITDKAATLNVNNVCYYSSLDKTGKQAMRLAESINHAVRESLTQPQDDTDVLPRLRELAAAHGLTGRPSVSSADDIIDAVHERLSKGAKK